MCEKKCLFLNQGSCSSDVESLDDLRYEQITFNCFPGARSLIQILLLYDDRFYERSISLHSTFVCSLHKEEILKQYWPSSYRKCWLCISLQKPLPVRFCLNFVKHDIKGVLKRIGVKIWTHHPLPPPPPTYCDQHFSRPSLTVTDILVTHHLQ
jgi:hypothetical protein